MDNEWKNAYFDMLDFIHDYIYNSGLENENTLDALIDLEDHIKEQIINSTYDD